MKTVTISGVDYPLRASMLAFQQWEEATGLQMAGLNENTSPIQMCQLAFFFAKAGLKREGKQIELDLDAFMDSIELDEIEAVAAAVAAAMAGSAQKKRQPVRKGR